MSRPSRSGTDIWNIWMSNPKKRSIFPTGGNAASMLATNRSGSACRFDFIGQRRLWDCTGRWHFGLGHGVQAFYRTEADNNSVRTIHYFDLADQLRRVHFAILHEPWFTRGLEHQFSGTNCHRRAKRSYQYYHRGQNVLPIEPIIALKRDKIS